MYTYVYDRFGNRWQQNGPNSMQLTFTGNSPTSPQNNNRMDGYSYDAAGNLLNDGTHAYTYDAENRLVSVDNGNTATYTYDSDGNRIEKVSKVNGSDGDLAGTWEYIYDQSGRILAKIEGTGWMGNIWAGSRHVATLGNGIQFSHSDWLGTERARTSLSNPSQYETIQSLPFGDGLTISATTYPYGVGDWSFLHFTGKPHDFESGLDYFGARYDASSFGRFLSPDPENAGADELDPQSWNAYAYATNDPLDRVDPDGRAPGDDPCKDDPDHCIQVKGDSSPSGPVVRYSWRVVWENAGRAAQRANDSLRTAWDWYRTSRVDTTCLAASTAAGAAFGASKGTAAGPVLQLALTPATGCASEALGGPAGGAFLGGLAGAGLGGAGGYLFGQVACRAGTGGTGGGGGRATGSGARLTKPQQRQTAEYLGMKEVKGMYSGPFKELVFERDGRYFSFSSTSHTAGEVFKELDRSGNRIATTDLNFNRIGP